ncbi:TIGR02611 family protein [Intrasporangium sp. DVR]|uniref:TIGR02611 family protein n=1 Tax=Intrasporangium sp. DVR TaxID=3127867 RepID=UPI003340C348
MAKTAKTGDALRAVDGDEHGPGRVAPEASGAHVDYSDDNATLDAHEDRWAWRARLRRHPATHLAWRSAVGVVGSVVTVAGLIMVPAPGPGWAVVILGLVILASEFEFAQRWLDFVKHHVHLWNRWVMAQPLWVRCLIGLGTLVLIWAVFWLTFVIFGLPGWTPDWAEQQLARLPGLD